MSRARARSWTAAVAAALSTGALAAAPRVATAHEVLHEVQRGRAIAVRVTLAGTEPIADSTYEVLSPTGVAHQKGRTDRNGMLSFVPDVAGEWRVRVVDASGHGVDTHVHVEAADLQARAAPGEDARRTASLGPIGGVGVIAAVFAALFAVQRRRRAG